MITDWNKSFASEFDVRYTGITQLFGVYVPFINIAAILCALLCKIGKNGKL